MRLRSWLFVPADSERKFEKALASEADALILDLEDAIQPAQKSAARDLLAGWMAEERDGGPQAWVRVNPHGSGMTEEDLDAAMGPGCAGIVLPKAEGREDVVKLARLMDSFESERGLEIGTRRVLVVATETPAAVFALPQYAPPHARLAALTWGAEDLSAELGATSNMDADGRLTEVYRHIRTQALLAACAAGVMPIEGVYTDFRDEAGLLADSRAARRDGFTGRLAIHPAQVGPINAAFTPSDDEMAHARRVVEAFAANPQAGALQLDGRMVDMPHLKAARKTLAAGGES